MFGIKGSRWFVLCVFLILCASATGAVAAGPVPEPPTCITVLPAISTACPSPSQSQTSRVASAEGGQSSQARALSVTATPSLARLLVGEVNRIRRAHHLRSLANSARLSRAGTEHATALATAGVFTHSWPTTGRLFSSCGGRDVQIAAAEFGLRRP